MISSLVGFITGIFKNLIWISYSIVESFIFMLAFNYIAPQLSSWGVSIPVTHINWMTSLCVFILIGFIGGWIKTLIPNFCQTNKK